MYFYELHEGDDEFFSDVLLARETEMDADVFFDIVQTIRRRVQGAFEHDTLIEAIAEELEAEYDFIFIGDERLTAAVNVSPVEAENFLADLSAEDTEGRSPDENRDDELEPELTGDEPSEDDDDEADDDEDDDDDEEEGDEDEEDILDDDTKGSFRTLHVEIDRNPDIRPN